MDRQLVVWDANNKTLEMAVLVDTDPYLRSANTKRGYKHDLAQFEEWRAGQPMSKVLVEEYAAHLHEQGKSPASINRVLSSIRWWARKLIDLVEIEQDKTLDEERVGQLDKIIRQAERVARVKGVKTDQGIQKGRHIAPGEVKGLLDACLADVSPAGVRDGALVALAAATGARRSELASLDLESYKPTGETEADVVIANGKGGKSRRVPICNGTVEAIEDWLVLIRGDEPGPLFCPIRKGGEPQIGKGLSTEALAQVLAKRAEQAGIKVITWHDFRRTVAGELLSLTDMVTVQKILGHSSPRTTARYDRRPHEAMKNAVRGLHIPYRRRDPASALAS